MWFIRRLLKIFWIEKKTSKNVLKDEKENENITIKKTIGK